MSKIEAGKTDLHINAFAVKDLVEDVIFAIKPIISQGDNALKVSGIEKFGDMRSDKSKIRQVLLNLMGNAAKFTDKGRGSVFTVRLPTIFSTP